MTQSNRQNTSPQVKICGLKTIQDVETCLQAGADFIGLVFFPKSPRHLEMAQAKKLAQYARGKIHIVALLVNPDDALVKDICTHISPDYIQLHGAESFTRIEEIKALSQTKIIKALPVASSADLASLSAYEKITDLILLDAKPVAGKAELPGGNGLSFDWELLINHKMPASFMLAGGLTPQNVRQAITLTRAPIVDVSSGVESHPGLKDPQKIRDFISATKFNEVRTGLF